MRPKEFYVKKTSQEDDKFIFTLLPSEFEKQYLKFIKEPIESITVDDEKLICACDLDVEPGADRVDEVWNNIQRAGIIIANLTGFKPNVMIELGVVLMKKEKVILIAEKALDGQENLPFNINSLGVDYYEPAKLAELANRIKIKVEKMISPEKLKITNSDVEGLLNDALTMRKDKSYAAAFVLFERMESIEPGNWFIYKEWAITYKEARDYDNALKKLEQALELTKANRYKSEIYTELGVVYMDNKMFDRARLNFEKAENLDRDNAELYERWSRLYNKIKKFDEAIDKIKIAINLDNNNETYKRILEFYTKKFINPDFPVELDEYLKQEQGKPTQRQTNENGPNDPREFRKFQDKYNISDIIEGEIVRNIPSLGCFVRVVGKIIGMIFWGTLPTNFDVNPRYKVGNRIKVKIRGYRPAKNQVELLEVR